MAVLVNQPAPAGLLHHFYRLDRDVCPNRTARSERARQRGKSDTLDAERIARETLAHWQRLRRSILTSRQHLLNEAASLLCELPLELREQLSDTKAVRPRLAALARRRQRGAPDAPTALRLRLLADYHQRIVALDATSRPPAASSRPSCKPAAARSITSAASRPGRSPSCSPRSATPAILSPGGHLT